MILNHNIITIKIETLKEKHINKIIIIKIIIINTIQMIIIIIIKQPKIHIKTNMSKIKKY